MNLKKLALTFALAIAAIAAFAPTAQATLSDDVTTMLGSMKTVYSAYYAPAIWKAKYAGYDLNTEYSKALASVASKSPLTMKQSRVIFRDFIYAMEDYHTSISFSSTEAASLPLVARGAEGRLFLVSIDRSKLSEIAFPFSVGDEVLSIDGVSATTVVDGLQKTFVGNAADTDRSEAELRLFSRRASRGFTDIPSGPVTLGLRRQGETAISYVQLLWNYTPEKVAPRTDFFSARRLTARNTLFAPRMDVDAERASDLETPFDLGARSSFMPALGTKIWESTKDATFDAYIYQNDDHKLVGYVRIPSYEPDDAMKAVAEFAATISRMESITDSLVIDQVNNPGGSVFYLYALAGILTDHPLATPRHRMAIAQADVVDAYSTLDQLKNINSEDDLAKNPGASDFGGYPASYELVVFTRAYAQFIIDQWTAGHRLTDPYWIGGVDHINPSAVAQYTKPILLLINELDFSGGDFFPTIMQDNKRVTVMGTRTAGAGGYVNDVTVPNNVGVASFRVTQSIAERASGNPIENLGVTPDVSYAMTAADYTSHFAPYVKAVKAALKAITP